MSNLRAISANILARLMEGDGSLSSHLACYRNTGNYPLLQEICFGSCRCFHALNFYVDSLLDKPIKNKHMVIRCLLIVGLYQLRELSIPQHAILNETVAATQELDKAWAKSLVNAILRSYLRKQEELDKAFKAAPLSTRFSFPQWMVKEFSSAWPDSWEELIENSNLRPPMTLRVNQTKTNRSEYLQTLRKEDMNAWPGTLSNTSVYLQFPEGIEKIPGFGDGLVSVQDEASQLVPPLLQLEPGLRVLDACAAPGGKTAHCLESEHLLTELVSVDISPARTDRIHENLSRLNLTAKVVSANILDLDSWWDGAAFDRILIDAPCSATGVIRRHPDVKLLRSVHEVSRLIELQKKILQAVWPCLKANGLLLYTTCSLLPAENDLQVRDFIQTTDNAKYEGIAVDWGVECQYGRQLLTGARDGPDGFFYSLLRKKQAT